MKISDIWQLFIDDAIDKNKSFLGRSKPIKRSVLEIQRVLEIEMKANMDW